MLHIGMVVDNEFYQDSRVIHEARYLIAKDYEVSVLCLNFGEYPDLEDFEGIKIVRISIPKKIKNILFGLMNTFPFYELFWKKHIRRFIRKYRIDVLHVHDLYMTKAVHWGNRKFNLPVVLDLHENYPFLFAGLTWTNKFPARLLIMPMRWYALEKKYLEYADDIIVLSGNYKMSLLEKYNFLKKDNIYVCPNYPDVRRLEGFSVDRNIIDKGSDFILFYFGRISRDRGIITCLEGLRELRAKGMKVRLLLIGPVDKAERDYFLNYFSDPELSENIIYYPWKDIKYLPSYILVSDVCLSPIVKNEQHDSGVANKVFQYMLFERPVLVSDSISQMHVIIQENCGVVFKSEDVDDFTAKVLLLLEDPELRETLGRNGKRAVKEKYNAEKESYELTRLYEMYNS